MVGMNNRLFRARRGLFAGHQLPIAGVKRAIKNGTKPEKEYVRKQGTIVSGVILACGLKKNFGKGVV